MTSTNTKHAQHRPVAGGCLLAGLFAALMLLCTPIVARGAQTTKIWIGAAPPEWRALHGWGPGNYMELFNLESRWNRVAATTQAFFLTERFVLRAPETDLARVISGLNQRHIAIAMQVVPLVASRACGLGVESYGSRRDVLAAAQRIKALGGTLGYGRMDEPLWFGHVFVGRNGRVGCQMPIAALAAEAAAKVADLKRVFPAVQIGDVEPFGVPVPNATWGQDLRQWFSAYRNATGQPLAFFHADCAWVRPNWESQFLLGVQIVQAAGIPLGVIYNGSRRDDTDLSWSNAAIAHFKLIEGQLGVRPYAAIFQSWTDRPRKMLPEDEPGTLTNVVATYLNWQAAAK